MKKNLSLLFALLCAITFFTACSDDDDTSWQQIPKEEIKGENATLEVNGETVANGSVKFETKSAEQAVVTLNNVILAYPEVAVDVTMTKQADESYNFSGEKGMTTAPGTRADGTPVIATIKVVGNVTLNGKIKVEATTIVNDPLGWGKVYSLTDYVTEDYTEGSNTIKNAGMEGALYIKWLRENNEEENSTENDRESMAILFRSIGSIILPQVLESISLESNGSITAKYSTGNQLNFSQNWVYGLLGMGYSPEYIAPSAEQVKTFIPTSGWTSSPRNLAYWFNNNGKLYVKLNITAILSQVMGTDASGLEGIITQILSGDAASIKALIGNLLKVDLSTISNETISMLQSWIKDGIPMNVKSENGHTYIYLDKAALDPILVDNETLTNDDPDDDWLNGDKCDILKLWTILVKANLIPEEAAAAALLLQSLGQSWPNTVTFDLGLDLQAAK